MPYPLIAFFSILVFSCVHLWAEKIRALGVLSQRRFLSLGGGVAISYVFVDLLPKLGKSNQLIERVLSGFFPYFERHAFVAALLGFLLFFFVDRSPSRWFKDEKYGITMIAYALFNFLVGNEDMHLKNFSLVTKNGKTNHNGCHLRRRSYQRTKSGSSLHD